MTERPRMEDLVRSWVSKAEHDLLNIENNLAANDIPWDTVCFHAQQCGEKYLKSLLVFQGIDFPKIHDLTELYALLPKELPLPIDPRLLDRLNPYAIEGRYQVSGNQLNERRRFAPSKPREPFVMPFAVFFPPLVTRKNERRALAKSHKATVVIEKSGNFGEGSTIDEPAT